MMDVASDNVLINAGTSLHNKMQLIRRCCGSDYLVYSRGMGGQADRGSIQDGPEHAGSGPLK